MGENTGGELLLRELGRERVLGQSVDGGGATSKNTLTSRSSRRYSSISEKQNQQR